MPPLRSLILRVTFVAPLWGVLSATVILCGWMFALEAMGGFGGAIADIGMFVVILVPALIVGYPIGVIVAFLTSLLLVAVVRRFGWSRRNAVLTAAVPGAILGLMTLGAGPLFALGTLATCLAAAALTWWSSLRGLLRGSAADVAELFA